MWGCRIVCGNALGLWGCAWPQCGAAEVCMAALWGYRAARVCMPPVQGYRAAEVCMVVELQGRA